MLGKCSLIRKERFYMFSTIVYSFAFPADILLNIVMHIGDGTGSVAERRRRHSLRWQEFESLHYHNYFCGDVMILNYQEPFNRIAKWTLFMQ